MNKLKLPSAYTILFIIIAFMAAMTWIIPAGEYQTAFNETLGKDVALAGTYAATNSNPQGIVDILMAPVVGIHKSIDLGLFILIIGGFLMVISATGAIDTGIGSAVRSMKGREHLMIPFLMICFAVGGTIYGMAEETIPFYMLIIPILIAAGYDSVTGVAIVLVGSGIGVLGSTINPFSTVIASDASGIPFTQGLTLRLIILAISFVTAVVYVMHYAKKIKQKPELSLVADMAADNKKHFLKELDNQQDAEFTGKHKVIMGVFALTFAVMIWGVAAGGWWMEEMSILFLASSILIAVIGGLNEEIFINSFVDGCKDLLGVVLILGIARGIGEVMDNGMITGTILSWGEAGLADTSPVVFVNLMYMIHAILSIFIPSTSGLAVFSMPIMAPLADFAGVGRELAVTAYQTSAGLMNLVTPTYGVVVAALAIGRISIIRWFKFMSPLLIMLAIISMACISISAA
ncbi:C4-dicarboxylate ABC transporter [Endozoicomonas sp. (ex Bugula neritina AB1)]|nr:C4-dicarboxylate ABC transporter [Endozoicomonas sp. (ex Bugula neritina AB1)]